jgi:hypothetical protein
VAVGALALAALVAVGPGAAPAASPRYVQRLQMPAESDDFAYADAVTVDPHTGEVFVCDSRSGRIAIFGPDGAFRYQIVGGRTFTGPLDVAVAPDGTLVVLANVDGLPAVLELDFDGRFLRHAPLDLPPGTLDGVGSLALTVDGERLYLLDHSGLKVWIVDRAGSPLGAIDLSELDSRGRPRERFLGRVDVYGDRVVVVVANDGEVNLFDLDGVRLAQVGDHGTGPCKLAGPTAAALMADGGLAIIDHQRMRIVLWDVATNRCLGDHYGVGNLPGFFYYPRDIALDARGRLYVVQGFEGRAQVYEGLPPAAGHAPAASVP